MPRLRRILKSRWLRRILIGCGACMVLAPAAFFAASALFPYPAGILAAARLRAPAALVLDRDRRPLRAFTGENDMWMFWTPLEQISPLLVQASISVEDRRFRSHPGVDPIAIARAAGSNLLHGRVVSGASTITMQMVRLLQPRPRTLRSKAIEAFRAMQLEQLLSKNEILEYYLNLAPYGGNLIGAEAASQAYFRKRAPDLTLAEAALLAGLPQSPARLRPDRHPARAQARRDQVLLSLYKNGIISRSELNAALAEPVEIVREPFPFDAPHFCRMVCSANAGSRVLHTTLDRKAQHTAAIALREAVDILRPAGVTNGSAVVIENDSAAVRALVGSCDFFSTPDAGQVNGAIAPRSPGSALKPFTYALAFELGRCTPETMLADVPASYTGYEPRNYDQQYRGPVTAREALATSLNIPAVRLLCEIGQPRLHDFLRMLGLTTLVRGPEHYGLGLTLGSAEATLLELTNAYASLARLGIYRPYRLLETETTENARRVLSEEAAYLVLDVLADISRLGGRPLWKTDKQQVRMAWKTGTSAGHRDAWTFACTPRYTVGVWLGNFDGAASAALVGIEAAAPVAARIIDRLHSDQQPSWYPQPRGLAAQDVCAVSGMPASGHCPTRKQALCIDRRQPAQRCTLHRKTAAGEVLECWPLETAAWLRKHQPGRRIAAEGETQAAWRQPPRILSPADGQVYVLLNGADARQQLLLKAVADSDVLYWFVNGTLHTSEQRVGGGHAFWPLQRGRHTITCSDGAGRSASVRVQVQ